MNDKELSQMADNILLKHCGMVNERSKQVFLHSMKGKHAQINNLEKEFQRRGKTKEELESYIGDMIFKPKQEDKGQLKEKVRKLEEENERLKRYVLMLEDEREGLRDNR